MLKVIAPIAARLREERIGAEPLAQGQIGLLVSGQAAMRAVMHQDCEPELARTDDGNGENVGNRVGPPRHQHDRRDNECPGVGDQRDAFPGHALAHVGELVVGQEIAGTHAKCGHGLTLLIRTARCVALVDQTEPRRVAG